jgi:hypothetical protein
VPTGGSATSGALSYRHQGERLTRITITISKNTPETFSADGCTCRVLDFGSDHVERSADRFVEFKLLALKQLPAVLMQPLDRNAHDLVALHRTLVVQPIAGTHRDRAGNVGGWSGERCLAVPVDDKVLSPQSSGWTRATGPSYYGHSVLPPSRQGATVKLTGMHLDRLGLLVAFPFRTAHVVLKVTTSGRPVYLDGVAVSAR